MLRKVFIAIYLSSGLGLLTGCPSFEYKNLEPEKRQAVYGTQPGYNRLSDNFAVDVKNATMNFYFLGSQEREKERQLIGTIQAFRYDYSNYGPRNVAYAISDDGTRLLYFDEPRVGDDKPKNARQATDLYVFDTQNRQKVLVYADVNRRIVSCVKLPGNYVLFSRVVPSGRSETFSRSTEGNEISLEKRMQELIATGKAKAICGPL